MRFIEPLSKTVVIGVEELVTYDRTAHRAAKLVKNERIWRIPIKWRAGFNSIVSEVNRRRYREKPIVPDGDTTEACAPAVPPLHIGAKRLRLDVEFVDRFERDGKADILALCPTVDRRGVLPSSIRLLSSNPCPTKRIVRW